MSMRYVERLLAAKRMPPLQHRWDRPTMDGTIRHGYATGKLNNTNVTTRAGCCWYRRLAIYSCLGVWGAALQPQTGPVGRPTRRRARASVGAAGNSWPRAIPGRCGVGQNALVYQENVAFQGIEEPGQGSGDAATRRIWPP